MEDVKEEGVEEKEELVNGIGGEGGGREKGDKDVDSKKVDKGEGYCLSKNEFRDIVKGKVDGIEEKGNYIRDVCEVMKDCGLESEEEVNGGMEKIIGCGGEVVDSVKEIGDGVGNEGKFGGRIRKKLGGMREEVKEEMEEGIGGDEGKSGEVGGEVEGGKDGDRGVESKVKEYVENKCGIGDGGVGVVKEKVKKEMEEGKDGDGGIECRLDKEIGERKSGDEGYSESVGKVKEGI